MNDLSETRWVVLVTPQKNMLARVSCLKQAGKIKIEELKITYTRKKLGGWGFRILGLPKSRTFSFHDGDVIQKLDEHYIPLRKYGLHQILWMLILLLVGSSIVIFKGFLNSDDKHIVIQKEEQTSTPIQDVVEKEQPVEDQKPHLLFLELKKNYQSGEISKSTRSFLKKLNEFNLSDQKEAQQMIAEARYIQCQDWLKQREERKAVISCEQATSFSDNTKAEAFLNQQDEKARKLYLEGYTVQKFNPDAARKKYALVLQSARTKSTWRGKAQYQLRKLK